MQGLLLNSEDLYSECTNRVLKRYGKPDLPWSIKAQLQGRPGPESARIFQNWAHLPIPMEEFQAQLSAIQRDLFPTCGPLPGVPQLLKDLEAAGDQVSIALATSSHKVNFHLKTDHLKDMFAVFAEENRVLGDDPRIPAGKGKPAPDIYLLALKTVNESLKKQGKAGDIKPAECLVFEDSVPGVEAGRRAGMQVVWCPYEGLLQEYKGREKQVLAGLMGEYKEEIQPDASLAEPTVPAVPGEVDDGWGTLVRTLEHFPYHKYGITVPA